MKRLRFSLRTLFALVTVLGILCGWFAIKVGEARHQRRAVEQLNQMGFEVTYESEFDGRLSSFRQRLIDIFGYDFFSNVSLVATTNKMTFDDSRLESLISLLNELPKLEFLNLATLQISDEDLNELTSLQSLKEINLDFTRTTKDAVDDLRAAMPTTRITWQTWDE